MAERKRTVEIRGIPAMSAFIGTINSMSGLWWKDHSQVYALDVKDSTGAKVGFTRKPTNQHYYHDSCSDTVVADYQGPLDIIIKVKGYSPWRGKHNNFDAGPSHVETRYDREKDMRKGPRAVRLRDDEHFHYGMNARDHKDDCDIRTSRDGWDANCTCGVLK